MQQLVTQGIILSRTDYGEADRIITLLTPEYGKLRLMARGVRKVKSKLAGGIELFSISSLTFIRGRGEIGTLVSARLEKYYDSIVTDISRVQLGYEIIKTLHRATEDASEAEYFYLLNQAFAALDDASIAADLIRFWFGSRLLHQAGHQPNLLTDTTGQKLLADENYSFSFEDMAFMPRPEGQFSADQIKFLRLAFSGNQPKIMQQVSGSEKLVPQVQPLVQTMLTNYIRL